MIRVKKKKKTSYEAKNEKLFFYVNISRLIQALRGIGSNEPSRTAIFHHCWASFLRRRIGKEEKKNKDGEEKLKKKISLRGEINEV